MGTLKDVLRVAVVMGGVSSERDVSLRSGAQIAEALRQVGHDVVEIDLRHEGIAPIIQARPDVAFLALHGGFGEDGRIQLLLEEAGIPFTGSGSEASRIGLDKIASKRVFLVHDVPTPAFRMVSRHTSFSALSAAIGDIGLPMVIKPASQGSSIGISMIDEIDQIADALALAFRLDEHVLLEEKINGRELTVGVLDDQALPIIEIRAQREFFDNEAKYRDGGTEYILDPDLDEFTALRVKEAAVAAHQAIGCRDISRTDIMLTEDGRPLVLEVNTLPGFTSRSLMPKAARHAGIEFPELCDQIARMAAHRPEAAKSARAVAAKA